MTNDQPIYLDDLCCDLTGMGRRNERWAALFRSVNSYWIIQVFRGIERRSYHFFADLQGCNGIHFDTFRPIWCNWLCPRSINGGEDDVETVDVLRRQMLLSFERHMTCKICGCRCWYKHSHWQGFEARKNHGFHPVKVIFSAGTTRSFSYSFRGHLKITQNWSSPWRKTSETHVFGALGVPSFERSSFCGESWIFSGFWIRISMVFSSNSKLVLMVP